jgi:hypothetical protein
MNQLNPVSRPLIAVAISLMANLSSSPVSVAEDTEPPLNYTLKIGDQSVRVVPGVAAEVKGTFTNPKVTLVPDAHRTFGYGGMAFAYPSNFAFEADFSTNGLKSWTLDGNNFVIMIHHYKAEEVAPADLAKVMMQSFGGGTKSEPVSRTFNGNQLAGVRILATVAGTSLIQDILALPAKNGSRVLILQDLSPQEKVSDDESKQVLKLLGETLKP